MFKRIIAVAVMLVLTSIFMWSAHGYMSGKNSVVKSDLSDIATNTGSEILIWYIGDEVTPYLEDVAATYRNGISIDFEQKSSLEFFENIDKLNRADEKAPDLYVIDSELLAKACYAGLAQENPYTDIYTEENYSKTALASSTYNEMIYGYPLYFQTAFLAYNKDYVESVPSTFEDILTYAVDTDISLYPGLSNILKWDTKNLLYNYGFLGSYINIGGANGDDPSVVEFDETGLNASLTYYQSLAQYFPIDIATVNNETVVDEFVNGKTSFIITGVDGLALMNESGMNYGITNFPDISEEILTTAMSATKVVAVNPYSKKLSIAEDIAKYMSYDNSESVYKTTGRIMGTRVLSEYDEKGVEDIMKQYAASESLPKLIDRLDLYIHLGTTLNNIWTGTEVTAAIAALKENIY